MTQQSSFDVVVGADPRPALVVLHGQFFDRRALRAAVRAAAPTRTAVFLDLPWHGDSRADDGDFGVYVDAVFAACARLQLAEVEFIGHSLGALVAVHAADAAAARGLRVTQQTLLAPPLSFSDDDRAQSVGLAPLVRGGITRDLAALAASLWLSPSYRDAHTDHVDVIYSLIRHNDGEQAARATTALGTLPPLPAAFATPTSVVLMRDDGRVPAAAQRPLAEARNASVFELPGGHLPQLEYPDDLVALLRTLVG